MKLPIVMIIRRIGTEIKLKMERTVNTLADVKFYCPSLAEYTPNITIEANMGSKVNIASIYVL